MYVSPEDEKRIVLASRLTEVTFEEENKPTRRDSNGSDSMYESPVESKTVLRDEILFGQDECAAEVTRKSADAESVTPNSTRHTFPFFGKKLRLFAEDDAVKPLSQKKSAEESEDGLKLPPNMQQIASDEDPPKRGIKFREFFRKSRHVESETGGFRGESDVTSDPLNEQIPVEVNIFDGPKQEAGEQMKREKRRSVFGVLLQNEAVDRDSDENGNERRKSRDRRRMTLKSIFGIEAEEKKTPKEEMQQRAERAFEGIVETDVISHADVERMTEFKRMETEVVKKNLPEIDSVSANPPGRMPPPGRWGPKSRKLKAFSKPEATHFDSDDNSAEKSDVPGERGGILTTRWKKNKKKRPVSFADEPTIFDIR